MLGIKSVCISFSEGHLGDILNGLSRSWPILAQGLPSYTHQGNISLHAFAADADEERDGKLRCEYLENEEVDICRAVLQGIKVPTVIERATYCSTENYDTCPIYRKVQRLSKKKDRTQQ